MQGMPRQQNSSYATGNGLLAATSYSPVPTSLFAAPNATAKTPLPKGTTGVICVLAMLQNQPAAQKPQKQRCQNSIFEKNRNVVLVTDDNVVGASEIWRSYCIVCCAFAACSATSAIFGSDNGGRSGTCAVRLLYHLKNLLMQERLCVLLLNPIQAIFRYFSTMPLRPLRSMEPSSHMVAMRC